MILLKKDVLQAAGSLQLCEGQVAGSEAAIHEMYDVFNDDNMEGILQIDAENTFNSINLNQPLIPSIEINLNHTFNSINCFTT